MKNSSTILAALLIVVSAGVWKTRVNTPTSANAPLGPAETKVRFSMEDQIVAKEREGLDALKAGKPEEFGKRTAEDAIFVDSAGMASKSDVMRNVAGFKLTDYSIDSVNFRQLSGKSGLITYKITETGNSHGREFTAHSYISSIWSEQSGNWQCLFSQETLAK
jgi:hypothetical protein